MQISAQWYGLFIRFPNRFMVGVDTFSTSHWSNFSDVVTAIRGWLTQLPKDVARKLAFENAAVLFKL